MLETTVGRHWWHHLPLLRHILHVLLVLLTLKLVGVERLLGWMAKGWMAKALLILEGWRTSEVVLILGLWRTT